jgi:hypothetical protein
MDTSACTFPPSFFLFIKWWRPQFSMGEHICGNVVSVAGPNKNRHRVKAPAPTLPLLYTKPTVLKQTKVNIRVRAIFSSDFF